MKDLVPFAGMVLLAAIVPAAIFIGRYNIKRYRQGLLDDLEASYRGAYPGVVGLELVPAFEVARYKYDMPPTRRALPQADRADDAPARIAKRDSLWHDLKIYFMPFCIFVLLSTLGFYNSLIIAEQTEPWEQRSFLLLGMQVWPDTAAERAANIEYQVQTATIVSYAFIGAYIWSLLYLVRRISNYDLTPLSFLRVSLQILLAIFTAIIVRHLGDKVPVIGSSAQAGGVAVGLAFLIGFYPTLGLAYLYDRFESLRIKREDESAHKMKRSLPLDMVDGMDTFIKFRFAEMDIEDVQTLATSNPILLFVESPYGLFQIIDWVAQAQLILAFGPEKALRLRALGISSFFCLEQVAKSPQMRPLLAEIIVPEVTGEPAGEAMAALVGALGKALYVQRLRQVWNAVLVVVTPVHLRPPNTLWDASWDAATARRTAASAEAAAE